MSQHPYLRAYLAGVAVPTFLLPFLLVPFFIGRIVYHVPVPVERVLGPGGDRR